MELAAVYHQRWEIEAIFDELKTHLRPGCVARKPAWMLEVA